MLLNSLERSRDYYIQDCIKTASIVLRLKMGIVEGIERVLFGDKSFFACLNRGAWTSTQDEPPVDTTPGVASD